MSVLDIQQIEGKIGNKEKGKKIIKGITFELSSLDQKKKRFKRENESKQTKSVLKNYAIIQMEQSFQDHYRKSSTKEKKITSGFMAFLFCFFG